MSDEGTIRERIMNLLIKSESPLDVKEIAFLLEISPREADIIYEHLQHIAKTVKRSSGGKMQLVMQPPYCISCGFIFKNLNRLRKPSRCPKCKSERITLPKFKIIMR